jgi:hypothetical protein
MVEEFFTGTTLAGRTLVLYYEHTTYDTFTDEAGEVVYNPAETDLTATLDGAPIDVEAVNWSSDTATVRTADLGTFTATNTDYAEDHSKALRRYLEHRPSEGWQVAILDKRQDGDEWSYTVTIKNDHLTERAEFRLSKQVMSVLARGAAAPTDEQVARQIAHDVRSDNWEKITERAEGPSTLAWIAHPS